jgi:hypothetical protein
MSEMVIDYIDYQKILSSLGGLGEEASAAPESAAPLFM